jgi:hypothetical protein
LGQSEFKGHPSGRRPEASTSAKCVRWTKWTIRTNGDETNTTSSQMKQHTTLRFVCFSAVLLAGSRSAREGPATGLLDQGFSWFPSVLQQTLSWYQTALHASHAAPSPTSASNFHSNPVIPKLISKFRRLYTVKPQLNFFPLLTTMSTS